MDRLTRLFIVQGFIERLRPYTDAATNAVFARMDEIEREHGLIPAFSAAEEAAIASYEANIERAEYVPELDIAVNAPCVKDLLPESQASILSRLSALPDRERREIFAILAQLIDIDAPQTELSLTQVADLRHTLKTKDIRTGTERAMHLDR